MPTKPKTFRPAGLPTKQQSRKAHDRKRGNAASRGYNTEWARYSTWFRSQPECIFCACGCGRLSQCVDHIIACTPDSDRWMDAANHAALSLVCHTRKTIRFDGAYGKPRDNSEAGRRDLQAMLDAARVRADAINQRGGFL